VRVASHRLLRLGLPAVAERIRSRDDGAAQLPVTAGVVLLVLDAVR
jgi:hypothetical protein